MSDPYARPGGQQGGPTPYAEQYYPSQQPGYSPHPGYPQQHQQWQPGHPGYPGHPGMTGTGGGGRMPRPGSVLAGAIMTYIGSGLLMLFGLFVLVGVTAGGSEFATGFAEGAGFDVSPGTVQAVAIGAGIGVLAQGGVLLVSAVLAQRGSNAWRIVLTVIGALNVAWNLFQLFTGDASILPVTAYVGVAVALFWSAAANEWYRSQRAPVSRPS
ncbi:hypothetical protein [Haloechinothrix sp. LS1_15]|uniref:hypothetical protein n=1 Tax=Haloechinothrix sp. LS1_15 TaxID=2652248 RepID=UPI0029471ABF|nr:hypothetical protein [Haloechinothrix sp. LS1_15]MDV6013503.1 hypothetical protein [Haloechinothrix sp. LS1_15]